MVMTFERTEGHSSNMACLRHMDPNECSIQMSQNTKFIYIKPNHLTYILVKVSESGPELI